MLRTFPLIVSILLTGCVASDDPVEIDNATRLMPNGTSMSGTTVNLASVSPAGRGVTGEPIRIAEVGAPFSGASIVGSQWNGRLGDGSSVTLRVDAAKRGVNSNADLWSYRISVAVKGSWRPLCVDAAGVEGFADTVGGTWNLAAGVPGGGAYHATPDITLACRGSSIAKCLELGYKPWLGRADDLAACVRAVRADYCGDGTSYTVDGTTVNMFDRDGIQSDDAVWAPEAEWTADGASCVSRAEDTRFYRVAHRTPSCFQVTLAAKNSCGTSFSSEGAMITELPRR